MMTWLRGLFTLRGTSFLIVGLGCLIVPNIVKGLGSLDRVGAMLVALAVLSSWAVRRTKHDLSCSRVVEPMRVQAGEEALVRLQLTNQSGAPTGRLMVEDKLPRSLAVRPRFHVDRLDPHATSELQYHVRSEVRGRYRIGPLTLRLRDPFGMCEVVRPLSGTEDLVVIPVVENIPQVMLGGEWTGGDDSQPSFIRAASEDDIGIREYQYGDPLHRVNWRATARRGEIMVRREESPRQNRATILIDARAGAHRGEGARSSLEWGVSTVASVAIHLARRNYALRVITETGGGLGGAASEMMAPAPDLEGLLLDGLADLNASKVTDLRDASLALGRSGDSLVIAILGTLSEQDASDLAHRRGGTTTAIAVLLRSWTWGSTNHDAAAEARFAAGVALLRNAGWRTVSAGAGDKLADLWPHTARGATFADQPGPLLDTMA